MIRKNGSRFSEKIMLRQNVGARSIQAETLRRDRDTRHQTKTILIIAIATVPL
jgi:hypothetical protein